MSNTFSALFETLIFLVLSGTVWAYVAQLSADTNVPAEHVGTVTLVGVIFTIGGLYSIAAAFGMVPPMSQMIRRRHA